MFEWARCYPDLYKICEKFGLYELENALQIQYTELEGILQDGPQCGLVALAICLRMPDKSTVNELYQEAMDAGYTYNGELFSARDFTNLVKKKINNKVTLFDGNLNCREIQEFLLTGGLMLVPYDSDKNNSPCRYNGHKAHWAVISGIIVTSDDIYVLAKHGKSRNTAIWKLKDLADSNGQLVEFSEDRKLSGKKYKLPVGGIGEENGLRYKSICIWPDAKAS